MALTTYLRNRTAVPGTTSYLATIKGLGMLTIAWLLSATCNFRLTATPEAAAKYAGLVPQLHESGSSVRGRPSIGQSGHARLRQALYLVYIATHAADAALELAVLRHSNIATTGRYLTPSEDDLREAIGRAGV